MSNQEALKKEAALAALADIQPETYIGVGTGSTVAYFIEGLKEHKHKILGAVPSSVQTENQLKACGIPIVDINAGIIDLYVDGADECNQHGQLVKGGGGALMREKILAAVAKRFVCIIDEKKRVNQLAAEFPLPIEVIPMARSYVAREIVKLGGDPAYREDFITDNGNQILDVHQMNITQPMHTEEVLNQITGVVCNGLFAKRGADKVLIATQHGIETLIPR